MTLSGLGSNTIRYVIRIQKRETVICYSPGGLLDWAAERAAL